METNELLSVPLRVIHSMFKQNGIGRHTKGSLPNPHAVQDLENKKKQKRKTARESRKKNR